tara:strand:+ start:1611 stop:1985 length:375 start_codon:yes stop_codon:yes gene_type:complete
MLEIGPPKYNQGDYVRIYFGSGHCKAMINKVKRNRRHDKDMREGRVNHWYAKRNPNGWFYQVAKHYGTGIEDIPDLRHAHWSRNLKLDISESEISKLIPADREFKLCYLSQGMTHDTEILVISN